MPYPGSTYAVADLHIFRKYSTREELLGDRRWDLIRDTPTTALRIHLT